MSKKVLVEISAIKRLLDLFLRPKSRQKEQDFIIKLKQTDPKLGKVYSQWDKDRVNSLQTMKKFLDRHNIDSSNIDKVLNKQY
jgi:hypothetical protein